MVSDALHSPLQMILVMLLKSAAISSRTGISISSFTYKKINSGGERISMYVDFEKSLSESKLAEHWKKKSKWFRKPKESPIELMEITFESACIQAIAKTYGIESDFTETYPIRTIATRSQ